MLPDHFPQRVTSLEQLVWPLLVATRPYAQCLRREAGRAEPGRRHLSPTRPNRVNCTSFRFEAASWTSIPTAWKVDTDAALRSYESRLVRARSQAESASGEIDFVIVEGCSGAGGRSMSCSMIACTHRGLAWSGWERVPPELRLLVPGEGVEVEDEGPGWAKIRQCVGTPSNKSASAPEGCVWQ